MGHFEYYTEGITEVTVIRHYRDNAILIRALGQLFGLREEKMRQRGIAPLLKEPGTGHQGLDAIED